MPDFELDPERLRLYVRDGLLLLLYGAVFYAAGKLARWWLRRLARRAERKGEPGLEREILEGTRRILTPLLTLAGVYIAFRTLSRLHPERYRGIPGLDLAAGFLYVLVLSLAVWFAIRATKVWLGWYRLQLLSGKGGAAADRHAQPILLGAERAVKILLIAGAAAVALRHFRQDISSLLVSLGVGSIAIGLAAQETIANMLAGFIIIIDRPFGLGDTVQLASGESGSIVHVGFRSTQIRLGTGALLIAPNRELVSNRLVNLTTDEKTLRVTVEFACDLAAEPEAVRVAALASAAPAPPLADDPRAELLLAALEGAARYKLIFSVRDAGSRAEATDFVLRRLREELRAAAIPLADPRRLEIAASPRPG